MDNRNLPSRVALPRDPVERIARFARSDAQIINLSVAENVLIFDKVKEILEQSATITLAETQYASSHGSTELREAVASFVNDNFGLNEKTLTKDQVFGLGGCRGALEAIVRSLVGSAEQGIVLTTAPHWQGYDWIFQDRLFGRIVKVPRYARSDFTFTIEQLAEITAAQPYEPVALLLTNPDNPTGQNLPRELMEEVLNWVLDKTQMHLISNELYRNSQTNMDSTLFTSMLALPRAIGNPDRVHATWGIAKDFGLSGFRGGFVLSRSTRLQGLIQSGVNLGQYNPFDTAKSWLLLRLFNETNGGRDLLNSYQEQLGPRYHQHREQLDRRGIKFFKGNQAAQFFWLDLQRYLPLVRPVSGDRRDPALAPIVRFAACEDREQALFDYLTEEAKVTLLPGQTLSSPEPGFFRLCYTAAKADVVTSAIDRIADALDKLKSSDATPRPG